MIKNILSVNFVDKDRDYNKRGMRREEVIELFPDGISYCFRSGHIPPILICYENMNNIKTDVVIQKYGDRDKDGGYSVHDYSNCISSNSMSDRGQLLLDKKYRIRKLTEFETGKLMGFTSEDVQKCKDVGISKSQLYKQHGNSICVSCIKLLFEHLYKSQYDSSYITYDENFTQAVMA